MDIIELTSLQMQIFNISYINIAAACSCPEIPFLDYRKQNHWAVSKTGVQEVGLEISSEESNQIIPSSAGFGTMHLSSAM